MKVYISNARSDSGQGNKSSATRKIVTGHILGLIAGLSIIALGNSGTYHANQSVRVKITAHCEAWNIAAGQGDTIQARYHSDLIAYISGRANSAKECARWGIEISRPPARACCEGLVAALPGRGL
jgi:hypothetical protein